MTIVFARTHHKYDSYTDFWRLVELSGFSTLEVSDCDLTQDVTYITTMVNQEWFTLVKSYEGRPRRAHLILWNLERPYGWAGTIGKYALKCWQMMHHRQFDEIWVSDRRLAVETELRFVVLGSHPLLGTPNQDKHYDFCHMSVPTNRRQSVYKWFNPATIGPNCWPPERDDVLKLSRFALNVHQDNYPLQEPLRFALFAAYGLPILTENIYDAYPWNSETMVFNPYFGIVEKMKQLLKDDYAQWREMGLRARQLMCDEFRFDKMVGQAAKESTER